MVLEAGSVSRNPSLRQISLAADRGSKCCGHGKAPPDAPSGSRFL
jgi:hypothetical protein